MRLSSADVQVLATATRDRVLIRHLPTGTEIPVDVSRNSRDRIAYALANLDDLIRQLEGFEQAKADLQRAFKR